MLPDLLSASARTAIRIVALCLSAALWLSPGAEAQGMCPGEPLCREVPKFSATITDFRASPNTVGNRPLNLTVRFHNKSDQPLILELVAGTAAAFDDRGNNYALQNTTKLTGIGLIKRNRFDPKFTLAPGESSDARLELNFYVGRNVIVGTAFDVEMSVREIDPRPGNQFEVGREHALSWQGLVNGARGRVPLAAGGVGAVAAAAGAVAGDATANAEAAAASAPVGDPCTGQVHCASSGSLVAKVVGVQSAAPAGNNHKVTVRVAFQNLGSTPMILNYKVDTGAMLDERGERYIVDSRDRTTVQGIPVSTRDRASSQFTLRPGESRTAAFIYSRYVGRVPAGTMFSPTLAVEQYELLASNQLKLEREHALAFGDVRGGASLQNLNDAVKGLSDLFKKKK